MDKILIHGASSWLGKATFNYLISKNYSYDSFILTSNKFTQLIYLEKKYKLINSSEVNNIQDEEIDILYFYSFPTHQIQNEELLKRDFNKLMSDFEVLISQNNIKKIFFASSGSVYGKGIEEYSIYSKYKKIQEEMVLSYSDKHQIEIQICRIFAVIAPFYDLSAKYALTTFINSAINNAFIEVRNPNIKRSYANFNDIVNLSLKKLETQIYDAATSDITINSLANLVGEFYNVEVVINQESSKIATDYLSHDDFVKNYYKAKNLDININTISETINTTIINELNIR
jgi:nucleoside-diphosphate-sugar epimerase